MKSLKEIWTELREEFKNENKRDPNDREMNQLFSKKLGEMNDEINRRVKNENR